MTEFDKESVRSFLRSFKRLMRSHQFYVIPKQENIQALIDLGLTVRNRGDELLSLSVLEYCYGPIPDHDRPGYVWVFGKEIRSVEIYIKLKIVETEYQTQALCLSFHPAARPLQYPFQEA